MPLYDGKPERVTAGFWSQVEANPRSIRGVELVTAKRCSFSAPTNRNMLLWQAKQQGCSRVLFVDQDMAPTIQHVARILSHDVPIVGALYPHKDLQRLRWVANFDKTKIDNNGMAPALEVGTGFLCVSMSAVFAMEEANPHLKYPCQYSATVGQLMWMLFNEQVVVDTWQEGKPPWPRLLSEDFFFCHLARKAGIPVYVDTKCQVGHIGPVDFLEVHKLLLAAKATPAPAAT
jgi:hypothetical protein